MNCINTNCPVSNFTTERHYEIPETEQAQGAAYNRFNPQVFKTFADHFANADLVLKKIAQNYNNASTIRLWPHHFDLGLMINLEKADSEEAKSVGAGFSPGDENYDQPYYYVYPWPYPPREKVSNAELPGDSFWHTENFVSAILTAEMYVDTSDQQQAVRTFLTQAIQKSIALLSA